MGLNSNCSQLDGEEWPKSHLFLAGLTDAEKAMVGCCSVFCVVNMIIFIDNTYFVWTKSVNCKKTALVTVWMIGLTPILSLIALFGMMIPRIYIYQDMLTIMCIALVMFKFVQLIRAYEKYHEKILEEVRTRRFRFNLGPCCCCCWCLPTAAMNRENAEKIKWLILQYPIISIATSVLTMVTWLNGNYKQGEWLASNPYTYLIIVRVVSILTALHGLNIVVNPCLDAMRSLLIRPKFIALRLSTFLYAVQGIVFDCLVAYSDLFETKSCFSGNVMGYFYQNLVFCVEMFLLTLLNFWSYRRALAPPDNSGDVKKTGRDGDNGFDGHDIVDDLQMEEQLDLEEVFKRDDIMLNSDVKTANSRQDSTKIGTTQISRDKDSNGFGYINQVNAVEEESGGTNDPSSNLNTTL